MIEGEKLLGRGAGDDATRFEKNDSRSEEEGFADVMRLKSMMTPHAMAITHAML